MPRRRFRCCVEATLTVRSTLYLWHTVSMRGLLVFVYRWESSGRDMNMRAETPTCDHKKTDGHKYSSQSCP